MSCLALVLALAAPLPARGQDAGALKTSAESYHDTLPGESVNGVALDFQQLLPFGGFLDAEAVLVDRKDHSALGRGILRLADVPLFGARVTAQGGDLAAKLDASPFHFGNDYFPVVFLRGVSARAEASGVSVSVFQGRNEQFRGIRLPTVTLAPEAVTAATGIWQLSESLSVDANAMRTANHAGATNPLFGVPIPERAETYGAGATVRLARSWIAQAKASLARYEYLPGGANFSGSFLSFVGGTSFETKRWKGEADYIRQGVNYIPLSTASVGNREGPHLHLQSLGERLTATVSASSYRNNLESNPSVPDLRSRALFASGSYRLASSVYGTFSYGRQDLTSRREGESSQFTQRTATSSLSFRSFGSTRLQYQYQTTEEPVLHQRLHELEIEQQPPTVLGMNVVLGLKGQHASEGASSLLYRGSLSGSFRDVYFSLQGEWGRDLGAANVFALNRNQTIIATISAPLIAGVELRVEGSWNKATAVVNPESIFVSQTTQEQLYAFNRRAVLVRLSRVFQWGRQPAVPSSPGGAASLPYGLVEGFVFQDRNGNGVRDPGEPGASGIAVRLDDGQTVKSDAAGLFTFRNVIEGSHNLGLELEVLPVAYNAPMETSGTVQVQRLQPGQRNFALIPSGSLSGRVEQALAAGGRVGVGGAVVTLLPADFSTYTDPDGNYSFSNLPAGRYSARLEEASLPEGAVVSVGASAEKSLGSGEDASVDPFVFSLVIEDKPVQKVFEYEQTVEPPKPLPKKKSKKVSAGHSAAPRSAAR